MHVLFLGRFCDSSTIVFIWFKYVVLPEATVYIRLFDAQYSISINWGEATRKLPRLSKHNLHVQHRSIIIHINFKFREIPRDIYRETVPDGKQFDKIH